MKRAVGLGLALVCVALPASAGASVALDDFRLIAARTIPLVVNEANSSFDLPTPTLEGPKGMYRFSTLVPSTATGSHGIGVDGNIYENIKGAPVKPGRVSSLTIYLPSGEYRVFDSVGNNRSKGYAFKLRITKSIAPRARFGKPCVRDWTETPLTRVWTTGVSCHRGERVASAAFSRWQKADFAMLPLSVEGFNCSITPFSAAGLKFTCLNGSKRITNAG